MPTALFESENVALRHGTCEAHCEASPGTVVLEGLNECHTLPGAMADEGATEFGTIIACEVTAICTFKIGIAAEKSRRFVIPKVK